MGTIANLKAENERLRTLLRNALPDLAWCAGFVEQAGGTVPQSVRRTIGRVVSASDESGTP